MMHVAQCRINMGMGGACYVVGMAGCAGVLLPCCPTARQHRLFPHYIRPRCPSGDAVGFRQPL